MKLFERYLYNFGVIVVIVATLALLYLVFCCCASGQETNPVPAPGSASSLNSSSGAVAYPPAAAVSNGAVLTNGTTVVITSSTGSGVVLSGSAPVEETLWLACQVTPISDSAGSVGPFWSGTGTVAGGFTLGDEGAGANVGWSDAQGNDDEGGSGAEYSFPQVPIDVKAGTNWNLKFVIIGGTAAYGAKVWETITTP